ncbi:MAG: glycosyltransferase family 2 protein [Caldilineales bacterium]|nr:glycosyltransferase family 2 protein [Caldilineales bacterium]MDW8318257.1 glycosyltransferase family 2 protein [Anaerolineae bacterium]
MDLAIVIVSYNVRELLAACLRSVEASLAASPQLQAETWVVDNASADGSAEMVAQRFPWVRLVASAENLGFAAANNVALRRLGLAPQADEHPPAADRAQQAPRYMALLNPDTEVQGDALAQMVAFLDTHPQAGGCCPRLTYPDGRFQHAAFRFPGLSQIALDFFPPPGRFNGPILDSRLNGRYPHRAYEAGKPFPVDFALGAALTVRSAAIRQVGLLDEGYFMYCEEMDWQRRLAAAGWPMYCVPTAHVVHHGGASTGQFRSAMFVALWRSRFRYFRRYHGTAFNRLAGWLVRLGLHAEARRATRSAPPDLEQRLAAYRAVEAMASASGKG